MWYTTTSQPLQTHGRWFPSRPPHLLFPTDQGSLHGKLTSHTSLNPLTTVRTFYSIRNARATRHGLKRKLEGVERISVTTRFASSTVTELFFTLVLSFFSTFSILSAFAKCKPDSISFPYFKTSSDTPLFSG